MPLWISEQLNESASMKILLVNPVVAGRLRAVVQLCNAGFIQLREQHHGPHNEPVRSSVITSFDAGSASVAFSPGIQSLLICSLQISPVNNNISKTGGGSFPSSGGTPPPTPTHGMSSGQTAGGEISWICNKTLLLRKTLQLGGMASLTNVVTKFFLTKLTFQRKKKL